jgi:hypothetical protein
MLYRLLGTAIVIFWLTMMGLLISTEVSPASSRLRAVPLTHVARLLFLHEQTSDLIVTSEGVPAGHLQVTPSTEAETQRRLLNINATFSLRLQPTVRQRVHASGRFEMDSALNFERFTLEVVIKDANFYQVQVQVEALEKMVHFTTRDGEKALPESHSYHLNEAGAAELIKDLGVDPGMMRTIGTKNAGRPEITARQSSLQIHGERADTYLINVSQSGQTLLEAHVDQLGKILLVKTFFGYTLAPDDLTP